MSEDGLFKGVVYDGAWKMLGVSQESVEPAKGKSLERIGMTTPDDIRVAAKAACEAQTG